MGLGSGSSIAVAWQRPMALLAGRMHLGACGSHVQAQGSQQHLHLQHQHQSQGFRRPGPAAAASLGLQLQRKLGPLLAVGDDELEITCVQELADGSMFFSFGGSPPPHPGKRIDDLASSRAELVATPAALHLPQRPLSHFRKYSPIPVLAARRKRGGMKQESEGQAGDDVATQAAAPDVRVGPSRPPSTFVKRSPIPKSSAGRRKVHWEGSEAGHDRTSVSEEAPAVAAGIPATDAVGTASPGQVNDKEAEHVAAGIPTKDAVETATLVQVNAKEPEHEHVMAEIPTGDAVDIATVVRVDAKEQELVTADIPTEDAVQSATLVHVNGKEQEPVVHATGSVNNRPKSAERSRRRTSRKAAKSDNESAAQSGVPAFPPAPAEAPAARPPAPLPSRPSSRFVRRSPIPALGEKRSLRAAPVVSIPVQSKETTVVKETVMKGSFVKETIQTRTSPGRRPTSEADARQETVLAASVQTEQTPTRPKSSFVRRSPISHRQTAKVVEAPVAVPEPKLVVNTVKVVETSLVVSESKVEEKTAAALPKSAGSSTRSRTKPAASKPVSQPVSSPPVEAPTSSTTESDSEAEDDQSPDSVASIGTGSLAASTLPQLKSIAKARGLKGYSKLKKSELIELIQSDSSS